MAENYTPNPFFIPFLSSTLGPNNFDFFDLCLHWASVVRGYLRISLQKTAVSGLCFPSIIYVHSVLFVNISVIEH